MATKTCINGHVYDPNVYGDNCPFCPAQGTQTIQSPSGQHTIVNNDDIQDHPTKPTMPINQDAENGTIIKPFGGSGSSGKKKLVGLLISYDTNPLGDVFKIYEGRNIVGRKTTVDIPITKDLGISSEHLIILYREAEGVYWCIDNNSSNGVFVNNVFQNKVAIQTNDVITIGSTKLIFLAIPKIQ